MEIHGSHGDPWKIMDSMSLETMVGLNLIIPPIPALSSLTQPPQGGGGESWAASTDIVMTRPRTIHRDAHQVEG